MTMNLTTTTDMLKNFILYALLFTVSASAGELKTSFKGENATPRINYAMEQVKVARKALPANGSLQVSLQGTDGPDKLEPEGFRVKSNGSGAVEVIGADQSGVLYGCLELAKRIGEEKNYP